MDARGAGAREQSMGRGRAWNVLGRWVLLALALAWALGRAPVSAEEPAGGAERAIPLHRQAQRVAVIRLEGEIDPGGRRSRSVMARSVERRIRLAERSQADAIVLDIHTPGGAVDAVRDICAQVKGSSIKNTVAWINTDAISGGAIVALACREIVVNDPATFGDAMPIGYDPIRGAQRLPDEELKKKALPPLIMEVLDSSRRANAFAGAYVRDERLAMAFVANDVSLWRVRSRQTGQELCIDRREFEMLFPGVNPDMAPRLAGTPGVTPVDPGVGGGAGGLAPSGSSKLDEALVKSASEAVALPSTRPTITEEGRGQWVLVDRVSDGTAALIMTGDDLLHYGLASNHSISGAGGIRTLIPIRSDEDLRAFFGASEVVRLNQSWSEGLVYLLTNPIVRAVLIVIFLAGLFFELTHPGSLVAGLIAGGAFVLLAGPAFIIGMASWWEIVAVLLGVALLAMEIFVIPGFGIAGILGIVLLVVGLVGTFTGGGIIPSSGAQQAALLRGLLTVLLGFVAAGVGLYFAAKHFGSLPVLNRLVLQRATGEEGDVLSAMDGSEGETQARVGEEGVALTPMRPTGRVRIGDRIFEAAADVGFVEAGSRVRVREVTAWRVTVEQIRG